MVGRIWPPPGCKRFGFQHGRYIHIFEIQKLLKHGIDSAIVIAESINTPDFFDYLLGEVTIEGNYKTYTEPHVASDKKYFNFSQKNKKLLSDPEKQHISWGNPDSHQKLAIS